LSLFALKFDFLTIKYMHPGSAPDPGNVPDPRQIRYSIPTAPNVRESKVIRRHVGGNELSRGPNGNILSDTVLSSMTFKDGVAPCLYSVVH